MQRCKYDLRTSGRGCPNEKAFDFDFCQEHLDTPRGKQHMIDVVQRGRLIRYSDIEKEIERAKEIPDQDYHTSALEQMAEALEKIQEWVKEARINLDAVGGPEHWRYKDRAGQEQLRSEVSIFERAMDRLSKHLGAMSKVSLQDKTVSLGKAQVDMMIGMVMTVVSELRLDEQRLTRANHLLLEMLERDANLTGRVDYYAHQRLAPEVIDA